MTTKISKGRLIALSFIICHLSFSLTLTSCEDMLEVESTRQVAEPDMSDKTDSLFYAAGILNAMQKLADVYVIQNEMRGDVAALTSKADTMLAHLYNFDVAAGNTNKYDSAYVYYNVINSCNYYLAHRDSTLSKNGRNVVENEYAAVAALRAWAYLQAVRQFGKVRFFLQPLTTVSQIDNYASLPEYDINQVITALLTETDIERFKGMPVPNYGGNFTFGTNNFGQGKNVQQQLFFVPVDVILGDLYLERGSSYDDYRKAADYYWNFLFTQKVPAKAYYSAFSVEKLNQLSAEGVTIPDAFFSRSISASTWYEIFGRNAESYVYATNGRSDIVTYIPMAVNSVMGVTSNLPRMFGYDYYAIHRDSVYIGQQIQITTSSAYTALSDSCMYYYVDNTSDASGNTRRSFRAGDMRRWDLFESNSRLSTDTCRYFIKYQPANVILYRVSTIYMHLAEALNRMGHPDAAFAVLKDGLSYMLVNSMSTQKAQYNNYVTLMSTMTDADSIADMKRLADAAIRNVYLTDTTLSLLTNTYQFGTVTNRSIFDTSHGIHTHGSSDLTAGNYGSEGIHSEYQYRTVVPAKMAKIAAEMGVTVPATAADTLAAQIDAVEDLICDEYALELTLEGTRFSDLTRMARHKNRSSLYGANYGGRWFDRKIRATRPAVRDLTQESSWYLPFQ